MQSFCFTHHDLSNIQNLINRFGICIDCGAQMDGGVKNGKDISINHNIPTIFGATVSYEVMQIDQELAAQNRLSLPLKGTEDCIFTEAYQCVDPSTGRRTNYSDDWVATPHRSDQRRIGRNTAGQLMFVRQRYDSLENAQLSHSHGVLIEVLGTSPKIQR